MAFTGNKASLVQISGTDAANPNNVYLDQSTGHYWRGASLDSAQDAGTTDPRQQAAPTPAPAAPPAPAPTPAPTPTAAPASGPNRATLVQVSGTDAANANNVYLDKSTGHYWKGTSFDNAQDIGTSPTGAAAPPSGGGPAPTNTVYDNGPSGPAFGAAPAPYQSSAWTGGNYTPTALPTALQTPYVAPTWQGGDFQEPALPRDLQTPYALPTQAELEASSGYGARLAAQQRVLERSAAAKGSVLSGGTQVALGQMGQDYASNEYGNFAGQTLGARQQNLGEFQTSRGNAYQAYLGKYGQFQDASAAALGARNQALGEYTQQNAIGQQGYQNQYSQYLNDEQRKMGDYVLNTSTNRNSELDYWQRLKDLTSAGAGAASGSYRPG